MDRDLSRKVLENYLKSLDPAKAIFLEKERNDLADKYTNSLALSLAKNDCSIIDSIYSSYAKSFEKKFSEINKLINSKFDYSKDESISFDRKTDTYPKSSKDRDELWRKIVKYQLMNLEEATGDFKKAQSKLTKRYELKLKDHKERTLSEVYEGFLSSFAITLDPHTSYFSPKELEEFQIATRLSLHGIGAVLRSEDGITTVESLVPGGPAFKGGSLKVKDQIIAVAQGEKGAFVDVIDKNLRDVVTYIRGNIGTLVRLKVRRGKNAHIISIVREEINIESQEAKSTSFTLESGKKSYRIGLIDLPSFYIDFQERFQGSEDYKSSTRDVLREISLLKKKGLDLLILDLRSNGGGALLEAVSLTGLFTGKTPVVQIKEKNAKPEKKVAEIDPVFDTDFPVIVMIDRQSASASEIVAGALKDYDRALIVGGGHTYGKGTVQHMISLDATPGLVKNSGLGGVKFTFSKYYRPLGSTTQLKGVHPHISFPSLSDYYEIGEKYYKNPLSWDQIKPLAVKKFNLVQPYLKALNKRSLERRKKSETFYEINKAIKEVKENGLKTKISLKKEKYKKDKTSSKKDKKKKEIKGKSLKVDKDKKSPKEDPKDKKKDDDKNSLFKKDFKPDLNADVYLQEALYIAGDYIKALKKEKFVSTTIKGFKKEAKKSEAKKSEAKKSEAKKSEAKKQ